MHSRWNSVTCVWGYLDNFRENQTVISRDTGSKSHYLNKTVLRISVVGILKTCVEAQVLHQVSS